jgi:hypothetical protein
MSNTNQHDRHVEILAEVTGMPTYILKDNEPKILYNDCLSAMQRAVEDETASLRTELERARGAVDIVKSLAEWSLKYPRSRIYPMQRQDKMDGELIAIEKAAKDFTQQTEGGDDEQWQNYSPYLRTALEQFVVEDTLTSGVVDKYIDDNQETIQSYEGLIKFAWFCRSYSTPTKVGSNE